MTTLITQSLLAALSEEAEHSPRRRKNRNFHPRDDYPGHRLLNAIEPDSYVMPHRHLDPNKDETIVCPRGRLGVVLFSPENRVGRSIVLTPAGEVCGIDIPHGVYRMAFTIRCWRLSRARCFSKPRPAPTCRWLRMKRRPGHRQRVRRP